MDYRTVTVIHALGFYSLAFIFATAYYLLNGYPGDTPFLPFVEGTSVMATFSLYILFGLVTGEIKNTFLKILFWVYICGGALLVVIVPNAVVMIGGFIFGLPAIGLGILTLGSPAMPVVLLELIVASCLLLWSYRLYTKNSKAD